LNHCTGSALAFEAEIVSGSTIVGLRLGRGRQRLGERLQGRQPNEAPARF